VLPMSSSHTISWLNRFTMLVCSLY
jgi:hypothetical protein